MNALESAFAALAGYQPGSDRAALLPIDRAVAAASADPNAAAKQERQLLDALSTCRSPLGREYLLAKLALVGSAVSVPVVAAFLPDVRLATAARNALQGIPAPAAAKALRDSLGNLPELQKLGVINSLGARRDEGSIRPLTALLKSPAPGIAAAAAAALGEIGTARAGRVLRAFLPKAPPALKPSLGDVLLVCAERLADAGRKADACKVCVVLVGEPGQPSHIRQAVPRILARLQ